MKITVQVKNVYGRDLIYPVCEKARIFAEISGAQTLRPSVLERIRALGYEVEFKAVTV
mgnify:CR=1 FL=1